jgi:hypothetical protein
VMSIKIAVIGDSLITTALGPRSNDGLASATGSSNESCTAASKDFMEDDGRRRSR